MFFVHTPERLITEARKEALSPGSEAHWVSRVNLFSPETLIVCQSDTKENPETMFEGEIGGGLHAESNTIQLVD